MPEISLGWATESERSDPKSGETSFPVKDPGSPWPPQSSPASGEPFAPVNNSSAREN
jgi:hypothetical protein